MRLGNRLGFKTVAVIALAGSAVIAAPVVAHDRVLATGTHQTVPPNTTAPLYMQLPATAPQGGSSSTVDSTTPAYALFSYSFGVQNPISIGGGTGSTSGKATFQDLTISKRVDSASLELFRTLLNGTHYRQVLIALLHNDGTGKPFVYLSYLLGNVFVAAQQHSGSSPDQPTESVSLHYESIKMTYTQQRPDGSLGTPQSECWDTAKNISACP